MYTFPILTSVSAPRLIAGKTLPKLKFFPYLAFLFSFLLGIRLNLMLQAISLFMASEQPPFQLPASIRPQIRDEDLMEPMQQSWMHTSFLIFGRTIPLTQLRPNAFISKVHKRHRESRRAPRVTVFSYPWCILSITLILGLLWLPADWRIFPKTRSVFRSSNMIFQPRSRESIKLLWSNFKVFGKRIMCFQSHSEACNSHSAVTFQ